MYGILQQILPPSGVEFAIFLKLFTEPNVVKLRPLVQQLVVARDNSLRIYEVRASDQDKQNLGYKLFLVRQHALHGIVTGLERVQTIATELDGLDRLLISFRDAKIALLEWSDALYDITTISIHSYERSLLAVNIDFTTFRGWLRTDPNYRCAALSLPKDAVAILPWYQTQVELDVVESAKTTSAARNLPYSPSFILEFSCIDERIRNVVDFVFLPGFNSPTMAILFHSQQTWTGRLKEIKDNTQLFIVTMDLISRSYQIITAVEKLPYDALWLLPCSSKVGGVVVIAANSLIHVDQASKIKIFPVNGWTSQVTDIPLASDEPIRDFHLEASRGRFLNDQDIVFILKGGEVHIITLEHEGRSVKDFAMSLEIGQTCAPSVLAMTDGCIFVGSTSSQSIFLAVEQDLSRENAGSRLKRFDSELDIDLYGTTKSIMNDAKDPYEQTPTTGTRLIPISSIPDYGQIADATFCITEDSLYPQLISSTNLGPAAGFSVFYKSLPLRIKKKMPAVAGRKGIWSMYIKHESKSLAKLERPRDEDTDTLIFSTDATPSPGASRLASKTPARLEISIISRIPILTIMAGPLFSNTHIVQVTSNSIRLLSPDGTEKQLIKDTDGSMSRPRIRSACIQDPFIVILREDDTLGLFVGEPAKLKLRRKDMSLLGDKRSRYRSANFFNEPSPFFQVVQEEAKKDQEEHNPQSQWLLLSRSTGILELWTLPKLALVFSNSEFMSGAQVLQDSQMGPGSSLPEDAVSHEEGGLDQALLAMLGETSPIPHLFILFKSGSLLVYQATWSQAGQPTIDPSLQPQRDSTLYVQFIKTYGNKLDVSSSEENLLGQGADKRQTTRHLITFSTFYSGRTLSGVFLTGEKPLWFLKGDVTSLLCLPCEFAVVHAFTACSIWDGQSSFLMNTDEGPCLVTWVANLTFLDQMVMLSVRKGRNYSSISFDINTSLIVAASAQQRDFFLFDDEGNKVWEPEAHNVSYPSLPCCALELIDTRSWSTIDGFEFATNEVVNVVETVNLETLSSDSGNRDFIAVGTSVHRGEDLAVRGATYIFEVADVVQDVESVGRRRHRLRLLCREDAKGPVTAICGMDGYLVSSMGQKIFVRAFDLDERLVGVAFLDVGVYVTSLRCLKNLLVIADIVKSVWFVAFQEDPFKLVVLSKEILPLPIVCADFFFSKSDMEIASLDIGGVLRIHGYDPTHVDTEEGARLLRLVEFNTHAEVRSMITIAKRDPGFSGPAEESKFVLCFGNGAVFTLSPVEEACFRRLHLLQGQLTRNVQHIAGLNPKMFRAVHSNSTGRPLLKGVLDGSLLTGFLTLPSAKQRDLTSQIGELLEVVFQDLGNVIGEYW